MSGLALRRIRLGIGVTQQDLADHLGVDPNTVKGWETARRPLGHAKAGDVQGIRFGLRLLGAPAPQLTGLDRAMHADWVLGRIVTDADPTRHPLAHEVATRDTTVLLSWPLTGRAPAVFASGSEWPALGAGERQVVYGALRHAAERTTSPLLRRQAYFLLAADPVSQAWLVERTRAEHRRLPRLNRWSPQWAVTRSLAVSRAVAGDAEPLRQFLDTGLVDDETLEANLRYYGYWAGECDQTFSSDEFMVEGFPNWRGERLLVALVRSLSTQSPYLELSVRTVWTLVARWPHLLDDPALAGPVAERVGALLDGAALPVGTRRELDQINYAASWRRH